MHRHRLRLLSLGLLFAAGIAVAATPKAPTHSGIDRTGMDLSVKPYEDFYQYANGKWLAEATIPPDKAAIAMFTLLQDRNREVLHEILEQAAHGNDKTDTIPGKVGAFYRSGMDQKHIDEAGATPLKKEFDRIAAVKDAAGLVPAIAHLHAFGLPVAFRMGARPDLKDSKRMIAVLGQGGLGLPDRDYYLKKDKKTQAIRTAYREHIQKMLTLLGDTPEKAAEQARAILDFETHLAKASKSRVELRDPKANYHLMTLVQLEDVAPGVGWTAYFEGVGVDGLKEADAAQPAFLKEVGAMLTAEPVETWKAYLRWHLLSSVADKLSTPFEKEDFHFKGTVLTGVPQMRPRWQRVEEATDRLLGEALGQLYVAKAFPPEAKARAEKMVHNIKAALRDRLETVDWMSPATKREALKKLDAIAVKIGYPAKWKDYSGLTVDKGVYVLNVLQAEAFERRRDLAKIGKPTDRTEWHMTPPTVNAYYNPSQNEIVFPAGILQPPFFDPQADDAVNYGGIGMVIGHELTHGFDDQGRQFDADGNLRDWWTAQDAATYKERAARIAAQYDAYTVLDGVHLNGKLTLGENIADLGGLKIAYLALKKALQDKPEKKTAGFTPEQRYFLAFAQLWRSKMRPEALRVMVATNPHSPPRYRVLGPLYNLPEFFAVFGATKEQAGDRLNPNPVQIW
jgi:putative endopeptidase